MVRVYRAVWRKTSKHQIAAGRCRLLILDDAGRYQRVTRSIFGIKKTDTKTMGDWIEAAAKAAGR